MHLEAALKTYEVNSLLRFNLNLKRCPRLTSVEHQRKVTGKKLKIHHCVTITTTKGLPISHIVVNLPRICKSL